MAKSRCKVVGFFNTDGFFTTFGQCLQKIYKSAKLGENEKVSMLFTGFNLQIIMVIYYCKL